MEESSSVAEGDQRDESMEQEVTIRERGMDQTSTCQETESEACGLDGSESNSPLNKSDILKAMEVTSSPVDHMRCFADAAGRIQESALDAATRGNQYINSCLRLNEEMKGIDNLATPLYPFQLSWCVFVCIVGLVACSFKLFIWTDEHIRSFSPIKVELAILSAAEKPLLLVSQYRTWASMKLIDLTISSLAFLCFLNAYEEKF
ncbi:uncharacterized protein LOC111306656 isoform X2 [Durio zibethinus]|uniref:Uncharacterized protein LOC111306656 isoform X2 n=1 Tax=Durio zibethinus TaxID=66656 RepID=A0A6P6A5W0_DURZI|nr:uncharacterized protein LOC111306656 isoform X2 [Durio zibethinus]